MTALELFMIGTTTFQVFAIVWLLQINRRLRRAEQILKIEST